MSFYIIVLLFAAFVVAFHMVFCYHKTVLPRIHYLFTLLILFTATSIIRTNNPDTSWLIILFQVGLLSLYLMAIYLLFSIWLKRRHGLKRAIFLLMGLGIGFICLNYILYGLGFRVEFQADIGKALILSYLGFDVQRISFPIGGGFVAFGEFSGGILVMALAWFLIERSLFKRILLSGMILISLSAMLLVDSRASLLFVFFTLLLVWVFVKLNILRTLPGIVWLIPAFPVVVYFFSQVLADNSLLTAFQRSETDLVTGNGRLIIWGICVVEFMKLNPIHLIGYGEFGQVASGASYQWAPLLATFEKPELTSAHNTFIQLVFNIGYFGVLVFLITLYSLLKTTVTFYRAGFKHIIVLMAFLIHYIFTGVFGSTYFFGHRAFFLFLAVGLLLFILRSRRRLLINNYQRFSAT